jgi:phage tail sheath protein FI
MPITPTYPGVYIEELPSPVRTIIGVSTSITAFIGRALQGSTDKPELIHSFPGYYRIFGSLWKESSMSYAVYQYFQNGGQDAVIIRVHNGAKKATFQGSTFQLEASNEGTWAKDLKIEIDTDDVDDDLKQQDPTIFKLNIKLEKTINNEKQTLGTETINNISARKDSSRFVKHILEEQSDFVRVKGDVPEAQPSGTFQVIDPGSDGDPLTDQVVIGDPLAKSGIYLLDNVDIFNMLCIPHYNSDQTTPSSVYATALEYCLKRRAMLIVDPPSSWTTKDKPTNEIDNLNLRNKNAVIYFPRIKAFDTAEQPTRLREFVPCGVVAGVIARTDSDRGIWKAPAGIEANLIGVEDFTVHLTDEENGELNPQAINCLRFFPGSGRVIWGARTLRGADRLVDQWKYLPVRRTALYIEESLYRGTQWVVFEPNDDRLWSQIRLNVGAFMHDLFRQGAFQGTDPRKAYFVKCDETTTTQFDIDRGIVNIVVGFAPLKPAEFVILQIQQITSSEEANQ